MSRSRSQLEWARGAMPSEMSDSGERRVPPGGAPRNRVSYLLSFWSREFAVFREPGAAAAEVRAKQLRALIRLTPFTLSANLLNGAIVWFALHESVNRTGLLLWLLTLVIVSAIAARGWWRRRNAGRRSASPNAVRRAVVHAAVLAIVWGVLPAVWFPDGDSSQRLIIAMLTTGMLGGGAIALAPIPMASIVYVAVLGVGACYALVVTREPIMLNGLALLVIYSATMIASAVSTARASVARLFSEREAAHQSHVIGLLLRDFEEHSADVLWESDREGNFAHISLKLATLLDDEAESESNFLRLIERRQPSGSRAAVDVLSAAMQSGTAFRDIIVPVTTNGATRWWSLTAKPLLDDDGVHIGWRGVIGDVSDRQVAQERLEYLANYDVLTGLANRRQLRDRVQRLLDGRIDGRPWRQSGTASAVLLLDVDHFKAINDTLGHATGDAVLQMVARRLQHASRQDDFIVRLGGDEFAMVVDSAASDAEVRALCERLLHTLREPTELAGQLVVVNASIGVAMIPEHGQTVDEVLGNADLALYASKAAGRSNCQIFIPELGERSRRRQLVEHELSTAVARRELTLHWQPQISAHSSMVRGAEALLRWTNPRLGTVMPGEFIPIAEQTGLVDEIGHWVLVEACQMASRHLDGLLVSVNTSPRQLLREDFVQQVEDALALADLPATRLELEITESLFMDEVPIALKHLHAMRKIGVRIALDDFGTGYSSLAYLRRFPFDTLKIDRAFVRELTDQGDARAIVKMIVELATTLGMETIAECVEEDEQLSILQRAGCHSVQGFLVARPMPIGELESMLGAHPHVFPHMMA